MKISAFGNRFYRKASRFLFAAMALLIGPAAWADAAVNNGRSFAANYDIGLMLLSGVGLMFFVARHRKKGGRDGDQ